MRSKFAKIVARAIALSPVFLLVLLCFIPIVGASQAKELHESDEPVKIVTVHEADAPVEIVTVTKPPRVWTAQEEIMLAKLIYCEARGVEDLAQKAAIVWCVLNRLDTGVWGGTITDVITYPYQFSYSDDAPVEIEYLDLAYDVLCRWETEKTGEATVGRTLPKQYLYFGGQNGINYFRSDYYSFNDIWDWSLPDPYEYQNKRRQEL